MSLFKRLTFLGCIVFAGLFTSSCNSSASSDTQETAAAANPNDPSARFLDKEKFAAAIKKKGAVVVDVRMPEEFEQGHIENAININFFDPEFKYKLLDLDRSKTYYLYCKNETRSKMSMKFMMDNDFKEVYVLKGGYQEWNTARDPQ